MKYLIVILVVLWGQHLFGQFELQMDTIKLNKTPLTGIDSTDVKFAESSTVFDGGLSLSGVDLNAQNIFARLNSRWLLNAFDDSQSEFFSALPYMGFTYSFGGQGTQFLTGRYSQAFHDSLILNINYNRVSSNGYFRNSIFDRSRVDASLIRKGRFYSFRFDGMFTSGNFQHSGGLSTDTLIESFGLEFSPVHKNNADSKYRNAELSLLNYFDVIPSSNTATGIVHRIEYSIVNRKYNEIDTLTGLYPIVNFNTDTTADQYNLPILTNFGGLFIHREHFYFEGGVNYTFWNYLNMSNSSDTSELGLSSKLDWSIFDLRLRNEFEFNLFGRFNEWYNHATLSYPGDRFQAGAWLNIGQYAIDPFKRMFIGNTFEYTTTGTMKEFRLSLGGRVSTKLWKDRLLIAATVDQFTSPDLYVFNGQEWQNDSLNNVSITSLTIAPSLQLSHFKLNTRISYNLTNTSFIPSLQFFSRVCFTGRLFEARILQLAAGADFRYNTSYEVMSYVPVLDVLSLGGLTPASSSRTNLDAFVNFGLERFTFYFRYENIAYFWEDQLREIAENYPIAAPRMRIGITWDFFN